MHSILSPSSAHIWKHCAAYPTMSRKYPWEESEAAKEGTAAHWVAWEIFFGRPVSIDDLTPNGMAVSQEMLDSAELFIGMLLSIAPQESWNIEQPVDIFDDLQCFGTPDAWAYIETTNTLTIADYKFGHRFVEEFENDQCVLYVKGIMDMLDIVDDQTLNVDIIIVQPRCYYRGEPVRTWHFKGSDIRGQINMLRMAGERALDIDPKATTNPGCGVCLARHDCPALQKATYADVETSTCSTPINITAQAAAIELKMLERAQQRMQARIDGLSTFVLSQVKSGQRVPHYQLSQSYGNRKWSLDDKTVISVGDAFGHNLRKTGVVTPSQAIKLGIDEAVIKEYSVVPMGELKLTPSPDPRKIFSGVK